MPTMLLVVLTVSSSFVRVADKTGTPPVGSNPVWVFFTDKGIFSDVDFDAAVGVIDRAARGTPAVKETPRADFDDIPVRTDYLRAIENMGGRLRAVSRWLNAASFELPPAIIGSVYHLPFVYDLRPVASRGAVETDFFPLSRVTRDEHRSTDTAYAHRFYGPSYDQAQMMGVPDLFFRGYYGSNVKLAIFDTGIKLTNLGISRVRIYRQHDFISGDNCFLARSESAWEPTAVDGTRYQGFARALTVGTVQTLSGSRDTLIAAFCADSFAYGYNAPRRAIFAQVSTDAGVSWTAPSPIAMSAPYGTTYEHLTLASHSYVTYMAYDQLTVQQEGVPAAATVYAGYFVGTDWHGSPVNIASGRHPVARVLGDTLYIAFAQSDSMVVLWKASVVLPDPEPVLTSTFPAGEAIAGVQLTVAAGGQVDILATGLRSGRISQYRSNDGGASFARLGEPVSAGAGRTRTLGDGQERLVVYEDRSEDLFSRLATLRSTDAGATWQPAQTIAESVFAIGGFDLTTDGPSELSLVYETDGFLHRRASTDFGRTWTSPSRIDTTGFNALPALAATSTGSLLLWFKRGDDNAVWEASDTARFSREQSDHGTRMASIIAGYQQGAVVGIAPGVDLLIAKTELHKVRSGRFYEYTMEEDAYIEALEWSDRMGASIVSTSLGYRSWYGDDQFDGKTAPISIAASIAARRGMVVVTAMGNRTDTVAHPWPEPYIVAPGDADGVITAGGVEKNMLPWRGTGTGPTSDGRIKPDLVALSDTVAVVSPDSEDYLDGSVGTSCATALIAGACALLKEAHPRWTAESIKAVLFATASRSVKSCTFGFGVPRVDSAFRLYPPDTGIDAVYGDEIGAVFPNPFIPAIHGKVNFVINLTRPASEAEIRIYSVSGALLDTITLNTSVLSRPGRYGENGDVAILDRIGSFWDGNNESGKPAAAGLYVAVLQTTFGRHATRFALVR